MIAVYSQEQIEVNQEDGSVVISQSWASECHSICVRPEHVDELIAALKRVRGDLLDGKPNFEVARREA